MPVDRLLTETDSPFLAPVPHRGKRNEPAHVVRVVETLAALYQLSVEDMARRTTENFHTLVRTVAGLTIAALSAVPAVIKSS